MTRSTAKKSIIIGGGGGSRTRVRKYSTAASTYVGSDLLSPLKTPRVRIDQALSRILFAPPPPGKRERLSCLNDALSRTDRRIQESVSRLKRLKRNRSCLRLCCPTCLTRPVGTSVRFYSFNYSRRNRDAPIMERNFCVFAYYKSYIR